MNTNSNTPFPLRKADNDSKIPLQFRYQQAQPAPQQNQIRSYSTSNVGSSNQQFEQRFLGNANGQPIRGPNTQNEIPNKSRIQLPLTSQANPIQGYQNNTPLNQNRLPLNQGLAQDNRQGFPLNQPNYQNQANNYPNSNYNSATNQSQTSQNFNANFQQSLPPFGLSNFQTAPSSNPLQQKSPYTNNANPDQSNIRKTDQLSFNRQTSQTRALQSSTGNETRSQVNMHIGQRPEINDNLSYHSKLSTNSRNHVLRAVSVNNEDHYHTLVSKEETIKDNNLITVTNYNQSIDSTKKNVLRNMSDNYKSKVTEIWNSYLSDQLKVGGAKVDLPNLNKDVDLIKSIFYEFLMIKTEFFIEELKNKKLNEVFQDIEASQNQRKYIDDRVQNIVDNEYAHVQNKNRELKAKITEAKNSSKTLIEQTIAKYKKSREDHFDMYDREFTFKLNGDQNLVRNTLRNAIPFLQEEVKKSEEKLSKLRSTGNFGTNENLKRQIETLESEIRFYKKT